MAKLRTAAIKAKTVLSANTATPIYVESLLQEKDLKTKITRAEYLQLANDLVERANAPLERLVTAFDLDRNNLDVSSPLIAL